MKGLTTACWLAIGEAGLQLGLAAAIFWFAARAGLGPDALYMGGGLLGGAILLRTVLVVSSRQCDLGPERFPAASIFAGVAAIAAGLAWGLMPAWLARQGLDLSVLPELAVLTAVFAGVALSGLQPAAFLSFGAPALGSAAGWAYLAGGPAALAGWGGAGVGLVLVSASTGIARRSVTRFRQLSRKNTETVKSLAQARDDALRAQAEVEASNRRLAAEAREREAAEAQTRASEKELSRILRDMTDTYFRAEPNGKLLRVSPSIEQLLGHSPEEALAQPLAAWFVNGKEAAAFTAALHRGLGRLQNYAARLRHRGGEAIWASFNVHVQHDEQGRVCAFEGTARDITAVRTASEALQREKERLYVTLQSLGEGVISTAPDGTVEYINPAAEEGTGWGAAQAHGRPLAEVLQLFDEASARAIEPPLRQWLRPGGAGALPGPVGLRAHRAETTRSIEITGAPLHGATGEGAGAVLVFRDVTRLRQLTQELSYQATHDALTGLVNRKEFERRVAEALRKSALGEAPHALCYLDLDRFKAVNDSCGHQAGDELLRQLTAQLRKSLRNADTLARLGGDEFGLLLQGCSGQRARTIGEAMRGQVEQFRFVWEDRVFRVGVSIGLVALENGRWRLEDALSAADAACYAAKEHGRNRVHVYRPGDAALGMHSERTQALQHLEGALDADGFELHFQSILALKGAAECGRQGELLLRLPVPGADGGTELIPPGGFLPAAERFQLLARIDRWVVRRALAALGADGALAGVALCSINLSRDTLADTGFPDALRDWLRETGVQPSRICFEVAESAAMSNLERALAFIRRLRALGCRIALDNFGAAAGSLHSLNRLPINFLKLDGLLVRDLATSRAARAVVAAINHVAHSLDIQTIAGCVEDPEVLDVLREQRVDWAQGFAIEGPYARVRTTAAAGRTSADGA